MTDTHLVDRSDENIHDLSSKGAQYHAYIYHIVGGKAPCLLQEAFTLALYSQHMNYVAILPITSSFNLQICLSFMTGNSFPSS